MAKKVFCITMAANSNSIDNLGPDWVVADRGGPTPR